jgi:hypothetical protein
VQYFSRRDISWGSLFGHLKLKGKDKGSGSEDKMGTAAAAEESRKRAEAIARELRLRRDQIGRPPAPPPPPKYPPPPASPSFTFASTRSTAKTGIEGVRKESPGEILRETLRGTIRSPPYASPPYSPTNLFGGTKTTTPYPAPRKVAKSDTLLSKKGNPFLSPLKAEQKAAMRKYLDLVKEQDSRNRKRYPWEENSTATPTPWDTGSDRWASIRRLLSLRAITATSPAPSRILKVLAPQPSSRETSIKSEEAEAETDVVGESKLYSHLRDLHVRSLVGYTGRGSEEAEEANRELRRRIVRVIRDAKKSPWEYMPSSTSEFERNMSGVFGINKTAKVQQEGVNITSLVKYVLAREGYDPALLQVVHRKSGEGVFDEHGGIESKLLMGINDERKVSSGCGVSYYRTSNTDGSIGCGEGISFSYCQGLSSS